ncbi:MAG: hypothetical protein K8T25_00880 [Planctomycetia bacterium]|nr:hypothetical protein [Planctomycetia bacterium]
MLSTVLLAANEFEFIRVLFVVVFLIIGVLTQLFKKKPGLPPMKPQGQAPPAGGGNRTLADEVDAFLRQTNQQARPGQPMSTQRPQADRTPPRRTREPVTAQVVDAQVVGPRVKRQRSGPGSLAESVGDAAQQISRGADRLSEQASTLGQDIDRADERIDQHLHSVFDHQVGQLEESEAEASTAEASVGGRGPSQTDVAAVSTDRAADVATAGMAAEIRQVFSNPADIRRAVILAEILAPPSDRW